MGKTALDKLREQKLKDKLERQAKKPPKVAYKGGRVQNAEKDKIRKLHMEGLDDYEIAQIIARSPEVIKRVRHELLIGEDIPKNRKAEIPYEIQLTTLPEWIVLQQQFSKSELEIFKIEYARLMTEMKDDLRPSDSINVFSLIKHMLLIDRNYIERKRTMDQMDELFERKRQLLKESQGIENTELLKEMREEIKDIDIMMSQYMAANTAKTNELKSLEERKAKIQEQLKITRDQRISKLESNKRETYIDLLKDLEDEEFRKTSGQMMEINKLAMYKEMERLSRPHEFMDGKVALPLLTAKTYRENSAQVD